MMVLAAKNENESRKIANKMVIQWLVSYVFPAYPYKMQPTIPKVIGNIRVKRWASGSRLPPLLWAIRWLILSAAQPAYSQTKGVAITIGRTAKPRCLKFHLYNISVSDYLVGYDRN